MKIRNLAATLIAALSLCLATGVTGCGDDDGTSNNNTSGDHLAPDMVATPSGGADFTCEGEADPALGYTVETEISGIVKEYREKNAEEGILVAVYETVQDVLDDNPYDTSAPSAPSGGYTINVPPGVPRLQFKMWDPDSTDFIVTLEFNEPVGGMPPGPPQATGKDRWVVSEATAAMVTTVLGMPLNPGLGIIAGSVYDCNRAELENVAMRVYDGPASDADRQLLSIYEGGYRNSYYFPPGGSIPSQDPDVMFTDPEGRFLIANLVPRPGEFVTMEMWGRHTDCPDGCLLSTQEIPVFPDSIAITDMVPLYSE